MFESARIFPPFTVKIGDISGDSFDRGQITENGDCPRKSGTSGHLKLIRSDRYIIDHIKAHNKPNITTAGALSHAHSHNHSNFSNSKARLLH